VSPAALELLQGGAAPDPATGLIIPPSLALVTDELPEPDDINVDAAKIDGNNIHQEIPGSIDDGELVRTMDGASTLTMVAEDTKGELHETNVFKKFAAQNDVRLVLDGRDFNLVQISKQDVQITLTWENRAVNELRKYDQPKKAYRDSVTRAEFVLSLVREVKGYPIGFYSPELHKAQPIAKKTQRATRSTKNKLRHRGIRGSHITVKHVRATSAQIGFINRVLDVGSSMNAPYPVMLSSIMTITQESDVHNDPGHGGVDVGLFNQNVHDGWPASRDVEKDSHAYFKKAIDVYRANPRMKAGQIAQAVQGSAFPHAYDQWKDEAIATLKAYGAHGGSGSITLDRYKRFAFRRGTTDGKKEDSWTAIKRLASEVNWRAFMVDDTLYFIDDDTLLSSAPRMTISEATPGVQNIDYDLDNGKKLQTATVYARANRWTAPAGTVVEIEDMGDPVGGRWLVAEHRRPIFAKDAEITLKRAQKSKLEPAPSATTVTLKGGASGIAAVDKAYAKAKWISGKKWSYKWGGGHGSFAGPYDCSGAVSAVLHAAGWLKSPETTVGLANWGHAGPGRFLTVWVKNGGPGGGHTFIEFHMPGKGVQHWGTGNWGKSWDGAGFNPQLHPHAGFSPRHWPGT
jgi:hypothetical protein